MKKICKRCFREFEEEENMDINPAEKFANLMLRDMGVEEDIRDLCPQCREELGIMNILGFGE